MSRSHQCRRFFSREKLTYTNWSEFFEGSSTPFIFKESADDDNASPVCVSNIVGYISNVVMDDTGFTYNLHHITDEINEDDFIEDYTIEPIYTQTTLKGKVIASKILCLVMLPQHAS